MILSLLILLFCVWNTRELAQVWLHPSAYEQYGWILFIVWCLPLFHYWIFKDNVKQTNFILLGIALFISLLGNIGDLLLLEYVGLALALAAFLSWHPVNLLWISGSILWMPGSSWIIAHLALAYVDYAFAFRLIFLSLISFILIIKQNKDVK